MHHSRTLMFFFLFVTLLIGITGCVRSPSKHYQKSVEYISVDRPRRFALDKMKYYFRPEEWHAIKKRVDKIQKRKATKGTKEVLSYYSPPGFFYIDDFIPYKQRLSDIKPQDQAEEYLEWIFGDGLLRELRSHVAGQPSYSKVKIWYDGTRPILRTSFDKDGKSMDMVWANYLDNKLFRLLHLSAEDDSELQIKATSFIDESYFGMTRNRYVFSQADGKLESFSFNVHGLPLHWTRNSNISIEDAIKAQLERESGHNLPISIEGDYFEVGDRFFPVYSKEEGKEYFKCAEDAQAIKIETLDKFYFKLTKENALKIVSKFNQVKDKSCREYMPERIWYADRYLGFYHSFDDITSYCTYSPKDSLNYWRFHYRGNVMTKVYQISDGVERLSEEIWYRGDDHGYAKAWYDPKGSGYMESCYWIDFMNDNPVHVYEIGLGKDGYPNVFPSGSDLFDYSSLDLFRNHYSFFVDGKMSYANFELHGMTIFYNKSTGKFSLWSKNLDLPWSVKGRSWGHSNFKFPYSTD